jgi:alkylated DNA repair protein alkB family protein 1
LLKLSFLGIIFIPNPFTATAQRMLIHHCLHKYTQAPNLTNLHAHYDIPPEGIWNMYSKLHNRTGECKEDQVKIPRTSESPKRQKTTIISEVDNENSAEYPTSFEQEHDTSEAQDDTDQKVNGGSPGQKTNSSSYSTPSELMKKLRWVTLGYQYDWSNKAYDFDHRVAFPEEARMISIAVAKAVEGLGYYNEGKLQWQNTYKGEDFVPEAGIVNYYQLKDTLMAHVDRSELNMAAPLVSIR